MTETRRVNGIVFEGGGWRREEKRIIKLRSNPSLKNVNRENLDPNTSSFNIPLTFATKVTRAGEMENKRIYIVKR